MATITKLDAVKELMKSDNAISVFVDREGDKINFIKYHNGQTPLTDKQIADEQIRVQAIEDAK